MILHLKEGAPAALYLAAVFIYGVALGELGRYQEGIDTLIEARDFGLEFGERVQTPKTMNSLGWAYHELCQYERAIACNEEAIRQLDADAKMDISIHEADANTRVNLGENYLAAGDEKRAGEYLRTVQEDIKKPEFLWARFRWNARCLLALGELALREGDHKGAQAKLDEVTADQWVDGFPMKKYQVRVARLQGAIHAMLGETKKAQREFNLALERAEALAFPTPLWKTHRDMAGFLAGQGKAKQAKAQYGKARDVTQGIADGLTNPELKEGFLGSEPIREVFTQAEKS